MKVGDLIIEYTDGGDIRELFVVIEEIKKEQRGSLIDAWSLHAVMANRSGWWDKTNPLPFYMDDWIAFELIEV